VGGSSIRVGVQRAMDLAANLDASLLLSCDQPFVTAAVLAQLIQLRLTSGKPIVASAYATMLGIPALFDRSCFPDLLRLKGDTGAKGIVLVRPHDVVSIDFSRRRDRHRHRCRLQKALSTSRRTRHAVGIAGCSVKRIKSFRSRSQPERPTLRRQSLEMRRGERAYPYTGFESS
jgi:MobA-like NTP transferase domain